MVTAANNLPRTVGELRAAGHRERGVKQEIRENLLTALAEGDEIWPGILGFDDTVLPQFMEVLNRPHGIVLVSGPTGSGKTTTLYAALMQLNLPDRKILTAENPVEYVLAGRAAVRTLTGLTA